MNHTEHNHMGHDHSAHGGHAHHAHVPAPVTEHMGHMAHDHENHTTDHGGMGGMDMGHMMKMYFHFGDSETILFSFWKISTVTGLVGSMVGVFLMAALYEGLKVAREYLQQRDIQSQVARQNPAPSVEGRVKAVRSGQCAPFSLAHVVQTLLHMIQMIVSYFLMLIFMTYNVWLCAAVVAGAGVGYFCFGWRRRITLQDSYEHCH